MIELPITAFQLQGYNNEHICLTIAKVYGFPYELSHGGGYFAEGIRAKHSFTTGELYAFFCQLQKCYDTISGETILENVDHELELKLTFQNTGRVLVTGMFQERPDVDTRLCFEMITDQAAIASVLRELKNVYNTFGDENGIVKLR